MAVDIKETSGSTVENAVENMTLAADFVTGSAVTVADNVGRAVGHPVREARKIERRGAAANKRFSRDVAGFVGDTTEAIDAMMPEKVALLGIQAIKDRARRKDLVGDVAYRALELVNGGLEAVLGTLNRLERATTPPTRPGTSRTRTAPSVKKAAGSARRTGRRSTSAAIKSARRGTTSSRRTERKPS
jgi:hypothetical protein